MRGSNWGRRIDSGSLCDIEKLMKYRGPKSGWVARLPPEFITSFKRALIWRIGQDESVIEKRLAGLGAGDEFILTFYEANCFVERVCANRKIP